jgi:hypothetical protein
LNAGARPTPLPKTNFYDNLKPKLLLAKLIALPIKEKKEAHGFSM